MESSFLPPARKALSQRMNRPRITGPISPRYRAGVEANTVAPNLRALLPSDGLTLSCRVIDCRSESHDRFPAELLAMFETDCVQAVVAELIEGGQLGMERQHKL